MCSGAFQIQGPDEGHGRITTKSLKVTARILGEAGLFLLAFACAVV
jgi:hypothetical protein